MRYFKEIQDGYILGIGTGSGGVEITEIEYAEILAIIRNKPQRTEATDYKLKTDLTWEAYEVEPQPEDEEVTAEEALEILLGGAV